VAEAFEGASGPGKNDALEYEPGEEGVAAGDRGDAERRGQAPSTQDDISRSLPGG
jgi:hypothetical protein